MYGVPCIGELCTIKKKAMRLYLKTLILAMLAFSLLSCERDSSLRVDGTVKVDCNVNLATKSLSVQERDDITVLDVLVFMAESGELLSYDRVSEGNISLYLQRGILHHCCFFVNAPEGVFSDVKQYDQVEQKVSQLVDNKDHFIMQNITSRMFVEDGSLEVLVSRLCSKITVEKIEPVFMDSDIAQSKVVFKRMFLMNVPSAMKYDGKPVISAVCYNEKGYDASIPQDIKGLILHEANQQIESSESVSVAKSLYCYTADPEEASLSEVKLVFEFEIAGSTNYYTVMFPKMKPNHEYHIESVRLLGFGSSVPGDVFDRTEVNLVVVVNPWDNAVDKDAVMN